MASRRYIGSSLALIIAVLLFASAASAAPTVSINTPPSCIGAHFDVTGSAAASSWNADSYTEGTVQRDDNSAILFDTGRKTTRPTGSFAFYVNNADTFPAGVGLHATFLVSAPDGFGAATVSWSPTYDRQNPTAPTVKAIRAVSGNQVLIEVSGSADQGCSGGVQTIGGIAAGLPLGSIPSLFATGSTAGGGLIRSQSILTPGTDYGAQAISTDNVDNESRGTVTSFTTAHDASQATVAGKLFVGNRPAFNVLVTATASGQAPVYARSNGAGWYSLGLNQGDWSLQYSSPDCAGVMKQVGWCDSVVTTTDTVNTNGLSGQIVWPPKSKTLVAGP